MEAVVKRNILNQSEEQINQPEHRPKKKMKEEVKPIDRAIARNTEEPLQELLKNY